MNLIKALFGKNTNATHDPVCTLYFSEMAAVQHGTTVYEVMGNNGQTQKIEASGIGESAKSYGWEDRVPVWEGRRSAVVATAPGRACSQKGVACREAIRAAGKIGSSFSPG